MTYLSTQTGARVPPNAWDVGTRPSGCGPAQCCIGQNGAGMATDADGLCPLVFRVSTTGTGVSGSISTGIQMLTRFAQFDVPTQESGVMTDIDGNALPTPYTTADFLKSVVPSSYVLPPPPPAIPAPTIDANGIQFDGVTPGTTVTFTINAFNDFVPQTNVAQIFEATISVLAGGCNVLDQRTVSDPGATTTHRVAVGGEWSDRGVTAQHVHAGSQPRSSPPDSGRVRKRLSAFLTGRASCKS